MAMNPRLLRPTASGFNPRQISGLALWLDAADSASLYTTDAGPEVAAVSSPLDISGCALWLDASDTSTITESSGLVSQWNDKSGNARHATATLTARPTTGTRSVNGRNALDFNGTSNVVGLTGSAVPTAATHTVFLVYQLDSASQSRFSTLLSSNPAGDQEMRVLGFGSTAMDFFYSGNLGRQVTSTVLGLGPVLFSAREASNSLRSSGASVFASSVTPTPTAWVTSGMTLGGRAAANWIDGILCEVIIYPSSLSDTDTARVEAYLAAKWGIANVHAPATAASQPVGYWGDKSGNGRHATQATAASRPTISATPQNGRKQLLFDATNDRLSLSSGLSLGTTGYSVLAVLRHFGGFKVWLEGGNLNPYFSTSPTANTGLYHWDGAVAAEAASALPAGSAAVVSGIISPSSRALYSQSALAVTGAGTSRTATVQHIGATSASFFWDGNIDELIVYSKVLTDAERRKAEVYLAAKWGITLAPQVSNTDAQDWVNRVYANGGTVSASTAAAVNTFCDAIDAAGIRDRFYRLSLMCGTGLNAALVPLYRGPVSGGTTYGNTTDLNNGPFVSGDYSETGASSGLKANGTSKYLDTGVMANEFTASDSHLGVGLRATETRSAAFRTAIGAYNGIANAYGIDLHAVSSRTGSAFFTRFGTATDCAGDNIGGATGALAVGDILAAYPAMYRNGAATGATATTSQNYPSAHKIYVFANNQQNTSVINYTDARMNWYSIGLTMTSAQALSYYNAVAAFNTALART